MQLLLSQTTTPIGSRTITGATSAPTGATTLPEDVLTLTPFVLLLLAIPVLLAGEAVQRRLRWLKELNIPPAVVGGLSVALLILVIQKLAGPVLRLSPTTADVAWLWVITPQWDVRPIAPTGVTQPLLILFFTCIGLNASWSVARTGGLPLLIYLGLASLLAVVQYVTGAGVAAAMGESPLLGIMCSGVSLMGGFGTAAGFAPEFHKAGLVNAGEIGVASAAFGVIAGGLIAGPLARRLMSDVGTKATGPQASAPLNSVDGDDGFVAHLLALTRRATPAIVHFAALFVCLKIGAFFSVLVKEQGSAAIRLIPGVDPGFTLTFPVYMGSMTLAVLLRNLHDALRLKLLSSDYIDTVASFALAWLLSAIMIGLRLSDLLSLALPMVVILLVQVVVMVAFSYWMVFRVMGRDYEAAAMSAGMIGFGLGATSNAVATMNAMACTFGPAPRAFLIVTVVGAFLIDFINSFLILVALNLLK